MNYDDLKAGREMDALVAEKVMEAKPCDKWVRFNTRSMVKFNECEHAVCFPPMEGPPHYSTKISAAWEVVEKMDLLAFGMLGQNKNGEWAVWNNGEDELPIFDPTAPLAICRAALAAKEAGR